MQAICKPASAIAAAAVNCIGEHLLCTRDEEAWDQLAQRCE